MTLNPQEPRELASAAVPGPYEVDMVDRLREDSANGTDKGFRRMSVPPPPEPTTWWGRLRARWADFCDYKNNRVAYRVTYPNGEQTVLLRWAEAASLAEVFGGTVRHFPTDWRPS